MKTLRLLVALALAFALGSCVCTATNCSDPAKNMVLLINNNGGLGMAQRQILCQDFMLRSQLYGTNCVIEWK